MTDHAAQRRMREDRAIARALQIVADRTREPGEHFDQRAAMAYFALRLAAEDREVFDVAFLDHHHQLIACERLAVGTLARAEVHPREVARAALRHNAAAVVVSHNHPSGNLTPSEADHRLTALLRESLALVEVALREHIIIGGNRALSFGSQECELTRQRQEADCEWRARLERKRAAAQKARETRQRNRERRIAQ